MGTGQARSETYLLFAKVGGRTWCGYRSADEFNSAIASAPPFEAAKVTYKAEDLVEVVSQVTTDSGDWLVVDTYNPSKKGTSLRRIIRRVDSQLEIIQEALVQGNVIPQLKTVYPGSHEGAPALDADIVLPSVEVKSDLASFRFMSVVSEMRSRFLAMACRTTEAKP